MYETFTNAQNTENKHPLNTSPPPFDTYGSNCSTSLSFLPIFGMTYLDVLEDQFPKREFSCDFSNLTNVTAKQHRERAGMFSSYLKPRAPCIFFKTPYD